MKTKTTNFDPNRLQGRMVAKIFNINPATISRWASRAGAPQNEDKTFNLLSLIEWRESRAIAAAVADAAQPAARHFNDPQDRVCKVQAEHDVAVLEGLPAAGASALVGLDVGEIEARLSGLADAWTGFYCRPDLEDLEDSAITAAVKATLERLNGNTIDRQKR